MANPKPIADKNAMTKSGFCMWQNVEGNSHELCKGAGTHCNCDCHEEKE